MSEILPAENDARARLEALKQRSIQEVSKIEEKREKINTIIIKEKKLERIESEARDLNNEPATPENVEKSLALLNEYRTLTGNSPNMHPPAKVDVVLEARGTKAHDKKIKTLKADSMVEEETGEKVNGKPHELSKLIDPNVKGELLKIAARLFADPWRNTASELLESKHSYFKEPEKLAIEPWFETFFDALVVYVPNLKSQLTQPEIAPGEQRLGSVDFAVTLQQGVTAMTRAIELFSHPKFKHEYGINKFADPQVLLTDADSPLYIKNGYPFHENIWLSASDKDYEKQLLQFVEGSEADTMLAELNEGKEDIEQVIPA